jgi:hypothetical protein
MTCYARHVRGVLTPAEAEELERVDALAGELRSHIETTAEAIAEVERGGTTNNNHALKDMWKAHLAPDAHHLFLIVPMINWKENGSPRERPFTRVASRIGAFFGDPRREVDVLSAHIFGY